jgi:hypothetical protein
MVSDPVGLISNLHFKVEDGSKLQEVKFQIMEAMVSADKLNIEFPAKARLYAQVKGGSRLDEVQSTTALFANMASDGGMDSAYWRKSTSTDKNVRNFTAHLALQGSLTLLDKTQLPKRPIDQRTPSRADLVSVTEKKAPEQKKKVQEYRPGEFIVRMV